MTNQIAVTKAYFIVAPPLAVGGLRSFTKVGSPDFSQDHQVSTSDLSTSLSLGLPLLVNIELPSILGVSSHTRVGKPTLFRNYVFEVSGLSSDFSLESTSLSQTHLFSPPGVSSFFGVEMPVAMEDQSPGPPSGGIGTMAVGSTFTIAA